MSHSKLKTAAEELKSRLKRNVDPAPGPTPFEMYGGWASPAESGEHPYVAEGEARRAGVEALADLYRRQGRM